MKAGQTINLDLKYSAEPEPTAIWSLTDLELKPDERVSMINEQKVAKLIVLNAKRSDTGKYTVKLTNSVGSDSATCEVVVIGPPAKPKGPLEVTDVKKLLFVLIRYFKVKITKKMKIIQRQCYNEVE